MRVFFSLLIVGCVGINAAQAQYYSGFGLRVGGNLASATFSSVQQANVLSSDASSSRSSLAGYQLGVGAVFGSGHWAVQPSLIFTQKGLKQNGAVSFDFGGETISYEASITTRVNYLELPINVVYSLGEGGEGFQLFAGPYIAYGVGGRANYSTKISSSDPNSPNNESDSGTQPMAFGNTFAEPDFNNYDTYVDARARRFDAGINAGIGYRRGAFQAQLGYGLGLRNAQPNYPASYQLNNDTGYHRTAQLTVAYYFPLTGKWSE